MSNAIVEIPPLVQWRLFGRDKPAIVRTSGAGLVLRIGDMQWITGLLCSRSRACSRARPRSRLCSTVVHLYHSGLVLLGL